MSTYSFFSANLTCNHIRDRKERSAYYSNGKQLLAQHGYRHENFFQFRDGDTDAQRKAKARAEHLASEMRRATGLHIVVQEGIFA